MISLSLEREEYDPLEVAAGRGQDRRADVSVFAPQGWSRPLTLLLLCVGGGGGGGGGGGHICSGFSSEEPHYNSFMYRSVPLCRLQFPVDF